MIGPHRSPRHSPVVQPVAAATSSSVPAPRPMASFTRGYRMVLQMQTGRYFSRTIARFAEISPSVSMAFVCFGGPVSRACQARRGAVFDP